VAPVREANESDADWLKRERDHAPEQMAYDLQKQKWVNANKKYVAVIKNMIEPTIKLMQVEPYFSELSIIYYAFIKKTTISMIK
jgi:hypothetical protein